MALVKRANVVLRVTTAELDKYLAKGYSIIDENGNVIRQAEPNDLAAFRTAYVEQAKEIAALRTQIATLEAELEKQNAKSKKKSKTEQEDE